MEKNWTSILTLHEIQKLIQYGWYTKIQTLKEGFKGMKTLWIFSKSPQNIFLLLQDIVS